MSLPLCSSTTNSVQKSSFGSIIKSTSQNKLYGFRRNHHLLQFRSSISRIQPLKPYSAVNFSGFSIKHPLLGFSLRRKSWFSIGAENGDGGETKKEVVDELEEARKESSMPSQFRLKVDETPDPPLVWPWLIALPLLVYTWRMVLWELSNWKKVAVGVVGPVVGVVKDVVVGVVGVVIDVVVGVVGSVVMNVVTGVVTAVRTIGTLPELALAVVLYFFGNPMIVFSRFIGTSLYTLCAIYSDIVASAPVQELTVIIVLTSVMLAIAEATVPDSVNSQPYLLTVAGIVGFAAVKSIIPELLFYVFLVGFFCYSRYVKRRDVVSSALPSAAVLTAVGEPWVILLVMGSYIALAIYQHSKKLSEENEKVEVTTTVRRIPVPLLAAALAIGIHVAAKWVRYRHLTWMIV